MTLANRTALVTGADGFIGSHLTQALLKEGANVRAFCLYNSNGSIGWLDGLSSSDRQRIDVRRGDIRDVRFVEDAVRDVEVVFHLAALIAIPYSYQAAESFLATNINGTLNVLEAARRSETGRVIHTSTSEVYGTPDSIPITEEHPLKGQSPYSATKIAADKLAEAFYYSYGTPVVTLRPFNTYGPRQSARAVIPSILAQLIAGRREVRLGNLEPRRDFTFVSDTVGGFIAAATAPNVEGTTIQLGTGRAESIGEIFKIANQVCGTQATVDVDQQRLRPIGSEVMVLRSDPALAAQLLGWAAAVTLEDGLAQTAEWVRAHLDQFDPDHYAV